MKAWRKKMVKKKVKLNVKYIFERYPFLFIFFCQLLLNIVGEGDLPV